jgi:hypothetical protein
MGDSETINEYSMKLTTLVGETRSLDDSEVIEKLFSSVLDRVFFISLERLSNLEILKKCRYQRRLDNSEILRKD